MYNDDTFYTFIVHSTFNNDENIIKKLIITNKTKWNKKIYIVYDISIAHFVTYTHTYLNRPKNCKRSTGSSAQPDSP